MALNFGRSFFPIDKTKFELFNFQDTLRNNSYLTFYAANVRNITPNLIPVLFSNKFDSAEEGTTATGSTGGAFRKDIDLDFDIILDNTLNIKGFCIANITLVAIKNNSNAEMYVIGKLRKWDGSSETEIASGRTDTAVATTVGTKYHRDAILMDITSKTKFIKGDTLRLTIEGWIKTTHANDGGGIRHDPTSRLNIGIQIVKEDGENSYAGLASDLTLHLPVVAAT